MGEYMKEKIVVLNVGKRGITESFIKEVSEHVKKKKIVKIKILRSALKEKDRHEIAEEIANRTNTKIVKLIGHTVILERI